MQVEICQEHDPRWDRYISAHPAGTFFHEWTWRIVISTSFGYEPLYMIAEDNGEVQGILPLFLVRSLLFGRSLVALPMAVYGGVVATNDGAEALLLDKAKALGIQHRAKYLELRGNPYQQAIGAEDGLGQADSKKQKDIGRAHV